MNKEFSITLSAGAFWSVLAILYLVLAVVSFCSGQAYDRQITKAPTMQATAQGATTFQNRVGKVTILGSEGPQGDAAVADLWADLRAYLRTSTWVNFAGFVLAAAAAVASFMFSRAGSPRLSAAQQEEA